MGDCSNRYPQVESFAAFSILQSSEVSGPSLSLPLPLYIYADMDPKTFLVLQSSLPKDVKHWQQTSFVVALLQVSHQAVLYWRGNNRIYKIWNVTLTVSNFFVTV